MIQCYDIVLDGISYLAEVDRDGKRYKIQVVETDDRRPDCYYENGKLTSALNDPGKPVRSYIFGEFCLVDIPRETLRNEIRQVAMEAFKRFRFCEPGN
jgi:hypothetical protein